MILHDKPYTILENGRSRSCSTHLHSRNRAQS